MAQFLLECYVAPSDTATVTSVEERAHAAADELTRNGTVVRLLRAIFVPEDETCFYLYEADTLEAVREAARVAALPSQRIVEAIPGRRDKD